MCVMLIISDAAINHKRSEVANIEYENVVSIWSPTEQALEHWTTLFSV
jgi:hypothetical protein